MIPPAPVGHHLQEQLLFQKISASASLDEGRGGACIDNPGLPMAG
jgi:hypothetical protein